jgi:hypothetical protein
MLPKAGEIVASKLVDFMKFDTSSPSDLMIPLFFAPDADEARASARSPTAYGALQNWATFLV